MRARSNRIFSISIRIIDVIASPIVCIWAYILSAMKQSAGLTPFYSGRTKMMVPPCMFEKSEIVSSRFWGSSCKDSLTSHRCVSVQILRKR